MHFRRPKSLLLFQPAKGKGVVGLGAPPSALLLEHGVISLGCMCVPPRKRVGGVGEFVFTFDDFASKVPGLPRSRRARGDFERLLDWLVENNVPPCRPVRGRAQVPCRALVGRDHRVALVTVAGGESRRWGGRKQCPIRVRRGGGQCVARASEGLGAAMHDDAEEG